MTVTTRTERKIAKRNFFLLYAASLVVGLVVIVALWQKFAARPVAVVASSPAETETYFMQIDTLLHQKMERFDDAYAGYIKARRGGTDPGTGALFVVRNDLAKTLDSIDRQAAYLSEGPKKSVMNLTAFRFRKAIGYRDSLMNDLLVLPKSAAVESTIANNTAELESLKRQLQEKNVEITLLQQSAKAVPAPTGNPAAEAQLQKTIAEKDRQIASLQTQLRQKEAALQNSGTQSRPSSGSGEWQQKYASLKTAYDKAVTNEKSLKNAYQTVADDNRRLLLQLQSMRKN